MQRFIRLVMIAILTLVALSVPHSASASGYSCVLGTYTGTLHEEFDSLGKPTIVEHPTASDTWDPYCQVKLSNGIITGIRASELIEILRYDHVKVLETSNTSATVLLKEFPTKLAEHSWRFTWVSGGAAHSSFVRDMKVPPTWIWLYVSESDWHFVPLLTDKSGSVYYVDISGEPRALSVECDSPLVIPANPPFNDKDISVSRHGEIDKEGNVSCDTSVGPMPFWQIAATEDYQSVKLSDYLADQPVTIQIWAKFPTNFVPCKDSTDFCWKIDTSSVISDYRKVAVTFQGWVQSYQLYKGEIFSLTGYALFIDTEGNHYTIAPVVLPQGMGAMLDIPVYSEATPSK